MGTRYVPDRYSGIARPIERLTLWTAQTGIFDVGGVKIAEIGEATPRAGIAVPARATDLALRASGAQTADVEVYANRAGLPALDEVGALWRLDGEADTALRGCDLPVSVAGWHDLTQGSVGLLPHVARISDDYALAVHCDIAGNISSQLYRPSLGTWAGPVAVGASAAVAQCLLVLPSGRVHVYYWQADGTDWQIGYHYSDDEGTTWTYGGWVLDESVNGAVYTPGRIRACYLDGVTGIFGHLVAVDTLAGISRDRIVQWASSDGGHRFTRVLISDGSDLEHSGAAPDVAVWRGEIVLARVVDSPFDVGHVRVRRLPSAWYPWTSGEETGTTLGITSGQLWSICSVTAPGSDYIITESECALWADDDGALYLTGRHCVGAHDGASPVLRSADGGATWTTPGTSALYAGRGQTWYWTGSGADEALSIAACYHRGRAVVVHDWRVAGAQAQRISATWLGGWQAPTMPTTGSALSPIQRVSWGLSGIGQQRPSLTGAGWTLVLLGGAVESLVSGGVQHACPAASSATNTLVPVCTLGQGQIAEALITVAGSCSVRSLLQDATPQHYDVEARITATTVQLWDLVAGAQIGATWNYTNGVVAVRIAHAGASVRLLAWAPSTLLPVGDHLVAEDRHWQIVASSAALVAGGGAATHLLQLQTQANSTVVWHSFPVVAGVYVGDHLISQAVRLRYPGSLCEVPRWAGRGVALSAVTGPAAVGDTWDVPATAEYPYEAMLPTHSPSPRHPWRSETFLFEPTGAETFRIAWQLAPVDVRTGSPLLAVLLDGISFGGAEVWLYYGGAWALAGSVGYWTANCARSGDTLEVTSGGVLYSAPIRRDELVGCLCEYVSGVLLLSDYQHRIVSNEPGSISTVAASVPLRFRVDSYTGAEPATPTVRIWPRRALLLVNLDSHAQAIRGIAIRASMNAPIVGTPSSPAWPPEDYAELATLAAGPVWALGTRHGWGRRLATEADTEIITAEDGTRIAYARAPARRRWSLTWADMVREPLSEATPDYISHVAGGSPLAVRRMTPVDLADILRSLSGGAVPVVWCEAIDSGGSGVPHRWADGAALARIVSAVERDLGLGDEERDACERAQDLTLEEEV